MMVGRPSVVRMPAVGSALYKPGDNAAMVATAAARFVAAWQEAKVA
jgi:hypothetical protein